MKPNDIFSWYGNGEGHGNNNKNLWDLLGSFGIFSLVAVKKIHLPKRFFGDWIEMSVVGWWGTETPNDGDPTTMETFFFSSVLKEFWKSSERVLKESWKDPDAGWIWYGTDFTADGEAMRTQCANNRRRCPLTDLQRPSVTLTSRRHSLTGSILRNCRPPSRLDISIYESIFQVQRWRQVDVAQIQWINVNATAMKTIGTASMNDWYVYLFKK